MVHILEILECFGDEEQTVEALGVQFVESGLGPVELVGFEA